MNYLDLFDGTKISDCPLPCTTIFTESRILVEFPRTTNTSRINLTFSAKVQVTITDNLKFYLSTFLSELGGSMGLWLGLGMAQAIELILNCVVPRLTKK